MKFIKKSWGALILYAYIFFAPTVSFALEVMGDNPSCSESGKICNPLGSTSSIPLLIQNVLEKALQIGIPLLALAIIYCGLLFVMARGKAEELTKAKDALLWTLIGGAILLGSWAIAKLISATVLSL